MRIFTKMVMKTLAAIMLIASFSLKPSAQVVNTVKEKANLSTYSVNKEYDVTGTITEASSGKILTGISISVPGYSAAFSDDKGMYSIKVPNRTAVLNFSGQGYQEKKVPVRGAVVVNTSLHEGAFNSFYDQANLPAGKISLSQTPYAVTSLNTGGSWERAAETPDSYLQGRVAGLNVVRRSGTPAIGAELFLRGFNSLYGTNQPLIVVDGVIYDINSYGNSLISDHVTNPLADIDVKDIDNITVIKDGANLYGTRGANGVILITTARTNNVATKIDFAAYGGYNFDVSRIPVMQAGDYRTYLSDVLKTSGMTDDQISAQPYMNDSPSNPSYYSYHNNTNWQDKIFKAGFNQNYHLRVTGGDDIAMYALTLGVTNSKGIISNTDLSRYFTRFNADMRLTNRLSANANLSFTQNKQNLRDQGFAPKTNPIYLALIKSPLVSVYQLNETGAQSPNLSDADIFNVSNPYAVIQEVIGQNINYRFSGSVGLKYELSRHFNISTLLGVTYDKVRENIFIPENGIASDTLRNAIAYNRSGSNIQRYFSLYNDTKASYNQTFGYIHELAVNLGTRYERSSSQNDFGLGYNSATDNFVSVGTGANALRKVGGQSGDWNWMDIYLNTDYRLLNRYLLSFNGTVDASSRFGNANDPDAWVVNGVKFAVLPSVALGWIISNEKFMSGASFIDLLKLRASAGQVGNYDIGNYSARQYYLSQNLLGMQGLIRGNIANPGLRWETVNKLNAGIDLAILNERLNVSFDIYRNKTINMLTYEPVISLAGMGYVLTNHGAMKTDGIDLAVNARVVDKAVKWDVGFTLNKARNSVTKIPGDKLITTYGNANYLTEVGKAANLFYGYKTNGVFSTAAEVAGFRAENKNANGFLTPFQPGDIRFQQVRIDGIIDENDMQVIGDPNPDFTGSVSTALSWKRFALDALFTFSYGNDIYNYEREAIESMSNANNQTLRMINRWRNEGQVTDVPRAAWGDPSGNARFSDRWIEDGSYLRLRTASLTYDIPFKEGMLKYARIYATGNNLFTLSKYLGYDPEFLNNGSIFSMGVDTGIEPQFRSVQLGIRIGL